MFASLTFNLTSAWFAFLLPCYGTWKSLAQRPISQPELERWAMYWSVMGVFVAFEHVAEWLVSWLPFYWETKIIFLLFLSLPQTQGSTWIYNMFLHPFFTEKEADIDAGIASAKANILIFLQSRLAAISRALLRIASEASDQPQNGSTVLSNLLDMAKGLWSAYGPSILGTFQASAPQRPVASHASSYSTSIHSVESSSSSDSSES